MLLSALERALAAYGVARSGTDVVLVACSGGADSVALAHGAVSLLGGRRVVLGHVDHAVRPHSDADAAAVQALGTRLGCAVRIERLDPGPDDEARLRTERYAVLERQRADVGARFIVTAHTRDDQAETVLMGLIRSAMPAALCGIPIRRGVVVRPLLDVPRYAIETYIHRHRLPVADDPTNREPRYLRNRVRKELIPLLERRYRPQLGRRLAALAQRMTELTESSRAPVRAAAPPVPAADGAGHLLAPWLDGRMWLKMERRPWHPASPAPDWKADTVAFDADLRRRSPDFG